MCVKCGKLVNCKFKKKTVKKTYTNKDARLDFISIKLSCEEGLSGEWDPTGEGREGFEAMLELLDRIDKHYGITK